MPIRDFAK
jgi:hypothetical protein